MANQFKLPDLGEGVHEGQVIRIHVREGDRVEEDQPLMEVETDKAAVEIPSPVAGVVTTVHISEDEVVNVGDVMVTFDGDTTDGKSSHTVETKRAANSSKSNGAATIATATSKSAPPRKPASPAVRKLCRTRGVDINTIDGSGPGGRVTRADVEAAASSPQPAQELSRSTPQSRIAASNLASNVAAQPVKRDIVPQRAASIADTPGEVGEDQWGEVSRLPISRPRRTIAQTMTQSWTTIPHVTDSDDADVTDLDKLRKHFNETNPTIGKLSLLPFVVRAVALALRQHPIFNSSFDVEQEAIVYRRYVNIAVGVQTERGLMAPVLRDADRLTVVQINDALSAMTDAVRNGSFEVNDLRGGTFTISNAGAMGGSRYSTPIINPPQVAVLAVGRSKKMPWVVEDELMPRLIMPLSMSFDHRIIDGAEEIAFARSIINALENPVHLM